MVKIYCTKDKGKHNFYLLHNKEKYYLFSQAPKRSVESFYKNGIHLDKALNHGIGKRDYAIHHTMDKLRIYIRYIETEYDIVILDTTRRKSRRVA